MKIRILILFACLGINKISAQVTTSGYQHIRVAEDIELIKISSDAYIHVSTAEMQGFGRVSSNGLILIDGNESILFDTPANDVQTETLVRYLKEKLNLSIKAFVPNHWHNDCMGGLNYLQKNFIRSYANNKTIEIARQHNLPLPDEGFNDSLELSLGNKKVFCWYPGAAHSMDNIVIWIPSEKILFAGCMCKSIESSNIGNLTDGDPDQYHLTIDKVISRFGDAKIVIPGHGNAGGFDLLIHTKVLALNIKR
jgi:metallo-beta-lactamase class B